MFGAPPTDPWLQEPPPARPAPPSKKAIVAVSLGSAVLGAFLGWKLHGWAEDLAARKLRRRGR